MIDDDIRAIKRKVFWNKALSVLAFMLTTGLVLVPLILLFIFKSGAIGRIAIAASTIFVITSIFLLDRNCTRFVQRLTGAIPVSHEDFAALESLSEDVSIVTGRPLPDLMLIDDSRCCNLFSIKKNGRAVIFLGPKLLRILEPDELRAAIAHEMAHIHNGDAGINTMTVTFRALSEINLNYICGLSIFKGFLVSMFLMIFIIAVAAVAIINDITFILLLAFLLPLAWLFFYANSFTLFLPSIELKRDLYADELSVKWTLQPESLINAMLKAQLHDESKRISFLEVIPFVPTMQDNPHKYMQSVSVRKRIDNLEEAVGLQLY